MPFNINEFRSTLDKHGGLARPNLFTVEFAGNQQNLIWNNDQFDNRDLKFFCQTATFPGVTVNVFEYRPNNIDTPQSIPVSIGHQQVECVFMVDDNYRVLNYLHSWMRQIVNFTTGGIPGAALALPGTENTANQQFPYELGYKKDYTQSMIITMYSRSPSSRTQATDSSPGTIHYDNKYVCRLYDVYPVQVGGISLEWGINDSYSTVPVSFSYSAFDMTTLSDGVEVIGPGIPL
jgi:hypothetical protein